MLAKSYSLLYYELRGTKRRRMASIGETLRRERQRRNMELDQVSQELKISPRFLEAIEEEKFDRLPAGVFAKSFVRQYARMLGLDEEEAANEVQRALTPPAAAYSTICLGRALGRSKAPPPLPEFYVPKVEAWQHVTRSAFLLEFAVGGFGLVVVAMLGCSLIYGWWQRQRHPVTLAASPALQRQQPAPPPRKAGPPSPAAPAPQEVSASPEPPAAESLLRLLHLPRRRLRLPVRDSFRNCRYIRRARRGQGGSDRRGGRMGPGALRWQVFVFGHARRLTKPAPWRQPTVLLRLGNAGGVTITLERETHRRNRPQGAGADGSAYLGRLPDCGAQTFGPGRRTL
jgi:transcriptional regulator with XRE-family HTH domain